MKLFKATIVAAGFCLALLPLKSSGEAPANLKGGGLYPNDDGPKTINVSGYPKGMQKGYKLFAAKCSACHTIARPINSQFLELSAEETAQAKKETPDIFADKKILQPEPDIWKRYVKRMMSKPGCPVGKDGKKIYEFLVFDSKQRKTGKNWASWKVQRVKLLADFSKAHYEEYVQLFGAAASAN